MVGFFKIDSSGLDKVRETRRKPTFQVKPVAYYNELMPACPEDRGLNYYEIIIWGH